MKRIVGIDLARLLAIVGMMAAHLLVPQGSPDWLRTFTDGYPSALFAVLGGFGMVFTSRSSLLGERKLQAVTALMIRGALVTLIGTVMLLLPDHPIAVVLIYYGTALILAAPFILLPTPALILSATFLSVLTPLALFKLRAPLAETYPVGTLHTDSLWGLAYSALVTGTYPAITWLVYLLIGIIAGRTLLHRRETKPLAIAGSKIGLVGGLLAIASQAASSIYLSAQATHLSQLLGVTPELLPSLLLERRYGAPALGGWNALLIAAPHSGSTTDILRSAGVALLITGTLIVVTAPIRKNAWWLKPFVATGGAALTVYVLHISLTAFTVPADYPFGGNTPPLYATSFWWQTALFLILGGVLAFLGKRGPLEAAVSTVSKAAQTKTHTKTQQPGPEN